MKREKRSGWNAYFFCELSFHFSSTLTGKRRFFPFISPATSSFSKNASAFTKEKVAEFHGRMRSLWIFSSSLFSLLFLNGRAKETSVAFSTEGFLYTETLKVSVGVSIDCRHPFLISPLKWTSSKSSFPSEISTSKKHALRFRWLLPFGLSRIKQVVFLAKKKKRKKPWVENENG